MHKALHERDETNRLYLSRKERDRLVGWLFCFTAYQPFSGHLMPNQVILIKTVIVWFGFYDIPTIVGYLMPNPFLFVKTVLFQTIQFSQQSQMVSSIGMYHEQFN